MEVAEEVLVDGGLVEGVLILEFGREIDAVVLTDVADGLGRDAQRGVRAWIQRDSLNELSG